MLVRFPGTELVDPLACVDDILRPKRTHDVDRAVRPTCTTTAFALLIRPQSVHAIYFESFRSSAPCRTSDRRWLVSLVIMVGDHTLVIGTHE